MALWSLFTNLKLGIEGYTVAISGSKAVRDGFAETIHTGFHIHTLAIFILLDMVIVTVHQ